MSNLKTGSYLTLTFPTGKTIPLEKSGRVVRCFASDGQLEVSFDRRSGKQFITAGTGVITQNGQEFSSFEITNPTATDITATIAWDYGELIDNRSNVSGNVPVINPAGQVLNVFDNENDAQLERIQQILQSTGARANTLSRGTIEKAQQNAFFDYMTGIQTVVSPSVNTDGIIIKKTMIGGNNYVSLFSDVSAPSAYNDTTLDMIGISYGLDQQIQLENFLIPAGNGLYVAPGSSFYGLISYDLL